MRFGDNENTYPPNPEREEPETTCCTQCEDSIYMHEAVTDFIGQPICKAKRCISWARTEDTKDPEGSELIRINEYYDGLIKQLK